MTRGVRSPSAIFTVSRGDGHLLLTTPAPSSRTQVLKPVTNAVFEMPDSDVRMTFEASEGGFCGFVYPRHRNVRESLSYRSKKRRFDR